VIACLGQQQAMREWKCYEEHMRQNEQLFVNGVFSVGRQEGGSQDSGLAATGGLGRRAQSDAPPGPSLPRHQPVCKSIFAVKDLG
jgi:hypothetical protein